MTTTRHITLLAALLAGILLGACGGDDETTKAGGGGKPVTLTIGTDDIPGKPASDQIEEFARRVERLSDGKLRIKPVWHAAGDGPAWDARVARMVTSGELDMSLTPTRAWDTEGVTTLRALNAPFLVDTDELLDEVVSDDELTRDLMAGLDKAGVVGLALFPDALRHPFALKKPLLGPEDYSGRVIRAAPSKTIIAMFSALGAQTNDDDPDEKVHAGLESAYNQDVPGTPTGNVTFFPKVNSLVIGTDALDRLDDDQREVLERAAAETRAWAVDATPTDAEAAAAFCAGGSEIVLASDAQLDSLKRAIQPVYTELERDDVTSDLIAAIRGMKEDLAAEATSPAACGPKNHGDEAHGKVTSELDGVYRFEVTDEHLRKAGETDPGKIAENHGLITQTLKGGKSCWTQRAPNPVANAEGCERYEVEGDVVRFVYPAGRPDVYRWRKLSNGDLKFTFVSGEPSEEFVVRAYAYPVWKRIGDPK